MGAIIFFLLWSVSTFSEKGVISSINNKYRIMNYKINNENYNNEIPDDIQSITFENKFNQNIDNVAFPTSLSIFWFLGKLWVVKLSFIKICFYIILRMYIYVSKYKKYYYLTIH